jgi:hypothetical protein
MTKKSIIFGSVAVVLAALFVVAAVLLFRGISRFSRTEAEVDTKKRQLRMFYEKEPFPSAENVDLERENVATAQKWFDRLINNLREKQIDPDETKSPSMFILTLQRKKEKLDGMFPKTEELSFGFERYLAETMEPPLPAEVPRLTQQLLIIEELAEVLNKAGVKKVTGIDRELFEGGGAAPSGGRPTGRRRGRDSRDRIKNPGAGLIPEGALYGKFHFTVEFEAKEDVLLEALNRLTNRDLFIVPTWVALEKQETDIRTADALENEKAGLGGKEESKKDREPFRDERVVSGPALEEPLKIRLELDVYNFAERAPGEA